MRMLASGPRSIASGLLLVLLLAWSALPASGATTPAGVPPRLHGRSAILLEAGTGTVLYELDADEAIPPASLTKLMTLHIALSEIEAGRLDPDAWITPGPDTWASAMPPHSSLMFLGPGQRLTLRELLEGLVVDSGNDAAVAVADLVAGSVPAFVARMNGEAQSLGFRVMRFQDPAGLSPESTVTAREYAEFCRIFISLHPDSLATLLSIRRLTYPLPRNLIGDDRPEPVTQENRNLLLGRYPGADGLKTGFIEEAGYHMAATATRGGMRLISVVLGVPAGLGTTRGEQARAEDSAALLDYGYSTFTTARLSLEPFRPVKVWKGRVRSLVPVLSVPPVVVVRKDQAARLIVSVEQRRDVVAPVGSSQDLGRVVAQVDGAPVAQFVLRAGVDVPRAGLFRVALDSVILFFRGLFGSRVPV
jgi:D-alanyl-D-alanine carboxypeptidase (penicillin-binding protein 5/6)